MASGGAKSLFSVIISGGTSIWLPKRCGGCRSAEMTTTNYLMKHVYSHLVNFNINYATSISSIYLLITCSKFSKMSAVSPTNADQWWNIIVIYRLLWARKSVSSLSRHQAPRRRRCVCLPRTSRLVSAVGCRLIQVDGPDCLVNCRPASCYQLGLMLCSGAHFLLKIIKNCCC